MSEVRHVARWPRRYSSNYSGLSGNSARSMSYRDLKNAMVVMFDLFVYISIPGHGICASGPAWLEDIDANHGFFL